MFFDENIYCNDDFPDLFYQLTLDLNKKPDQQKLCLQLLFVIMCKSKEIEKIREIEKLMNAKEESKDQSE